MMIERGKVVKFYQSKEFGEFLNSLPSKHKMKIQAKIYAIEEVGLIQASRAEWVKSLEDDMFEVRVRISSNSYRGLYFHLEENKYIITHGFKKKTQEIHDREKEIARKILRRYKK